MFIIFRQSKISNYLIYVTREQCAQRRIIARDGRCARCVRVTQFELLFCGKTKEKPVETPLTERIRKVSVCAWVTCVIWFISE